MLRRLAMMLAVVCLLSTSLGCAQGVRRYPVSGTACGNLVFNSQCNLLAGGHNERSEWPSTVAYQRSTELIDFRETIIDRQGRFGHSDDYLYRRFESTRTGRGHR